MRDMPMFTTENGVASLTLNQIPYTKSAWIRIQNSVSPQALLEECIAFCKAVDAEYIYATGDSCCEKYNSCTTGEPGYNYVNIHSHATKFGTMSEDKEQKNAILNEKEAKQLISIFKKEMQAANESIFNEEVYGISISGYEWQELYIPESFTETISFLEAKFEQYDSTIEKEN